MCRDSVALDVGPGNSNSAVNCMLGWLYYHGFRLCHPAQTGLCTSISYAVNKIPRPAMDPVPKSLDHLKENPCRPMSSNCMESLLVVLNA